MLKTLMSKKLNQAHAVEKLNFLSKVRGRS